MLPVTADTTAEALLEEVPTLTLTLTLILTLTLTLGPEKNPGPSSLPGRCRETHPYSSRLIPGPR